MDESAAGRLTVGATALVARVEVVRAVVRAAAVRCHEHQLHEGRERAKRENSWAAVRWRSSALAQRYPTWVRVGRSGATWIHVRERASQNARCETKA